MNFTRFMITIALATALAASAGCATVKPWDRDLLAQPHMRLVAHPMLTAVDDHIYFSKEGSTGGMDVAGGGCGCN